MEGRLFVEPLFYVFFIYGASFLLMSFLILQETVQGNSTPIMNSFIMLAFFGFTHGITELIDWIRFIMKTVGIGEFAFLSYLSQGFLIVSFFLLLQFGINLLSVEAKRRTIIRSLPTVVLVILIGTVIFLGITDVFKIGLLARYSLGFLGSVLSGISLFVLAATVKPLNDRKLVRGLIISGIAFACYAIFGGLIIQPIAGIPIQAFRAACAVAVALSTFSVLGIYEAKPGLTKESAR